MAKVTKKRTGPKAYEVYGRISGRRYRRRFTLSNSQNPEKDASEYYRILQNQQKVSGNKRKKIKITEYIPIYLRHCEANNTWATVRADAGRLRIFARWGLKNGVKWLSDVDHATLDRFIDYYRLERGGRNPNNYIACLHSMLTYAVRHNLVMENPMRGYKKQNPRIDEKQYFSLDEIERMLVVAPVPYPRYFLVFLLQTGCRLSEAVNMRWQDVDFDHRVVTIRSRQDHPTKSGKARTIPMTETLYSTLLEMDRSAEWIFVNSRDQHRTSISWHHRTFARLLEAAEIPKNGRSLKSLRHTFVTHLFNEGQSLDMISKIVGHHSPAVTAKIYAHLLPQSFDIIKNLPY